jgi:hypothetical protein
MLIQIEQNAEDRQGTRGRKTKRTEANARVVSQIRGKQLVSVHIWTRDIDNDKNFS